MVTNYPNNEGNKIMSKKVFLFIPILCAGMLTGCGNSGNTEEDYGLATTPVVINDNTTVVYGLYPQTHVSDSGLISSLEALTTPESNGWYLFNGKYYAKVSAKPNKTNYKFDDDTKIVEGTTYWFKCEPIKWKILSNEGGEYFLLSSVLLDVHRFNSCWQGKDSNNRYSNNYEYSEIRAWLNDEFYNSAFALGKENIKTTTVDNSASTTDNSSIGGYACNDTNDKVFLLSYQDFKNSSYGFSTSGNGTNLRTWKATDYARAKGVNLGYSSKNCGYYWTRSPYQDGGAHVWYVDYDGGLNRTGNGVDSTNYCVNPAIKIKIN